MTAEQPPEKPEPVQLSETSSTANSPSSSAAGASPPEEPAGTPPPEKSVVSPPVETLVLPTWTNLVTAFFRSGFFFMLFGTAFLYFAFANGQRAHSAMTFILVVIGSAIVLFGTGTQAAPTK